MGAGWRGLDRGGEGGEGRLRVADGVSMVAAEPELRLGAGRGGAGQVQGLGAHVGTTRLFSQLPGDEPTCMVFDLAGRGG